MRDDPHRMAGEERRPAGTAPLEQESTLTGLFKVVEAAQAERAVR
jgi:hypothetical protein